MRTFLIAWQFVLMVYAAVAAAQVPELPYVKLESREATRAAAMEKFLPRLETVNWHVVGPFDNIMHTSLRDANVAVRGGGEDLLPEGQESQELPRPAPAPEVSTGHNLVYPPERGIALDASYRGKFNQEIWWQPIKVNDWKAIDLERFGSTANNTDGVAYIHGEINCDRDAVVTFEMGSDDGLKFWFNGKLLVDVDAPRSLNVEDHRLKLPFVKGRNTILVKVMQGGGQWAFQMRPVVDTRIAALLEYRLEQDFPSSPESRHYRILTIIEPEDVVLEVSGIAMLPDGRPVVATRRGEVWMVEKAFDDPPFNARFKLFASGLHEPLGAQWLDGGLLLAQRGELTRLVDLDGDDRAEEYQTFSDAWGISGNYHEYAFGPRLDGEGRLWVTLNVGFCGDLGKSTVPWRGWAVIINPDGSLTPVCGGLRSPNGLGANAAGDMFFTDNQGDWVGTNKLSHMTFGDWHGHPAGNRWYGDAAMTEPRGEEDFKPPAVWFPYKRMGQSASDIRLDDTDGKFGPFSDQLFVGDQMNACVMRVFLEKVDGEYQGACFPFRSGFDCGVNRMVFAPDGSMFVGMTNRGWGSLGRRPYGVQRLVYTGVLPFEVHEMRAKADGFELTFTMPIDRATASDLKSYAVRSFTYHRWQKYGSPEIEHKDHSVRAVDVAADGLSVRVRLNELRKGYVHELKLGGIRNEAGEPLLHDEAWYTLLRIPGE